jgi:hypothetical protein
VVTREHLEVLVAWGMLAALALVDWLTGGRVVMRAWAG